MRVKDGALRPRYGYNNLAAVITNFESAHGGEYIQGYNSSNVLVDSYVTFERLSTYTAAKCQPWSRAADTGTKTVITNNGTPVELTTTGDWRGFAYNDQAYFSNPNNSQTVYRHAIGTTASATSWVALVPPGEPLTALTLQTTYGGGATNYASMSWAGLNTGTKITYTGNATSTNSQVLGDALIIAHTGTPTTSSVEIDITGTTAGGGSSFDWYANDIFGISLFSGIIGGGLVTGGGFRIDKTSVKIEFINKAGSPVTVVPTAFDYTFANDGDYGFRMDIRVHFDNKTRADWGDGSTSAANIGAGQSAGQIKKIKITYKILSGDAGASYNYLRIAPIIIGGVQMLQTNADGSTNEDKLRFGYSYYNSSTGFESGIAGQLTVLDSQVAGQRPIATLRPFGVWLTLTGTNGSSSDNNRLYVQVSDPTTTALVWKRVATQADSTLAIPYRITYSERLALTTYKNISPFTLAGAKFGVPWKGWVVWFYIGGSQNVKHSRVGDPERQASDLDQDYDLNRGATFSLADNFGDEALCAFPIDETLFIGGAKGWYAQQGTAPYNLTPPKKLPGSPGVAGYLAACSWRDDSGTPGCPFMDATGSKLYFAIVNDASDVRGMAVNEIGQAFDFRAWFIDGQAALWTALSITADSDKVSKYRVFVDEQDNALWVVCGKRAAVWRMSTVTGEREWEPYDYGTASSTDYIQYPLVSTKRRMRWLRSSGRFDENEWSQTTNAFITGSSRDGGNAFPSAYWRSKTLAGENRRLDTVFVERDTLSDTATITAYCTRQPSGQARTLAANARFVRYTHLHTGWEHSVKIAISETAGAFRRLEMENISQAGRRVKIA